MGKRDRGVSDCGHETALPRMIAFSVDCRNGTIDGETIGPLQSSCYRNVNSNNVVMIIEEQNEKGAEHDQY